MPAAGPRARQPVGSAAWIATEKENVLNLVEQEMEEIEFPVYHELEWLNEHMAEIFSRNYFNLTDIFKTPGKLRGKTPRTVRKYSIDGTRVPLSDLFSSNRHVMPIPKLDLMRNHDVAKNDLDKNENPQCQDPSVGRKLDPFATYNTDSGYHDITNDDETVILPRVETESNFATLPLEENLKPDPQGASSPSVDCRTTEASFHSAQENIQQRGEMVEPMNMDAPADLNTDVETPRPMPKVPGPKEEPLVSTPVTESQPDHSQPTETGNKDTDMALDNQFDDTASPSYGSTPDRLLVRKSSLTFASLPAREPLVTKKSLGGARISRTSHVDITKLNNVGRPSYFAGQSGGTRMARALVEEHDQQVTEGDKMDIDGRKDITDGDSDSDLEATKLHNKSSTQRLHEKISLLGKLQPSRPTKSIPSASTLTAPTSLVNYPELPSAKEDTSNTESRTVPGTDPVAANEEEWIKPLSSPHRLNILKSHKGDIQQASHNGTASGLGKIKPKTEAFDNLAGKRSPLAKDLHSAGLVHGGPGSASTPSPRRLGLRSDQQNLMSSVNIATELTTPPVSPKRYDGALNMSKSKLQSLMKTAKGLFTSSAGVSAAAKMETSPSALRSQPSLYRKLNIPNEAQESQQEHPSRSPKPGSRETQIPTEKERDRCQSKDGRRRIDREQEQAKAPEPRAVQEKPSFQEERHERVMPTATSRISPKKTQPQRKQSPQETDVKSDQETKFAVPSLPHQAQAPKQNERRPVRPTRETAQKPKPQPVSIRVGSTLSRHVPLLSTTPQSSSVQETALPVSTPSTTSTPKHPVLTKKASTSSLQTSSSVSSLKSSASGKSQRKANLGAEKKKQEEREAKRELERKQIVAQRQQQEETRRQELKNQADVERRERERPAVDDPKKAAQRQAIEQRRQENARRLERQGSQQPNASTELNSILQQEKSNAKSSQRPDLAPARPPSRLGSVQSFNRSVNQPPTNPTKSTKRALEEDSSLRVAMTASSAPYQSTENKRRKTEDDHDPPPSSVRPTMAPPIRQSIIRKDVIKPQMYPHAHAAPPPLAAHQPTPPLYKNTSAASHQTQQLPAVPPQRPAHPLDMAKYTSSKIPFADTPNPSHEPPSHKTPGQNPQKMINKFSPHCPNGGYIHLPEFPTDSEDEDSDAEIMPVPRWARPDELEALLIEQEGRETESIFGPIGPFSLEETFKADKKIKKFRDRTSSANWAGPDGLTQEEIRRDAAERQRLRLNGGWTFAPS